MNSSTLQQIGFALPGLYAIVMVTLLDMQGDVPKEKLYIYYYVTTAFCIVPGIIAWYGLLKSNFIVKLLKIKDFNESLSIYNNINKIFLI